jgi:uncharacterized protein YbjT (DUF2867 family)
VEVVEGDMSRPETLTTALSGVDRVLLISSSDQQMAKTQSRLIDAATESGVQHIVKWSGLSAADVGTPFIFGSMPAEIGSYLESSGLAWTHLRPSQFMTEYLREWPTITAGPRGDVVTGPRRFSAHRRVCTTRLPISGQHTTTRTGSIAMTIKNKTVLVTGANRGIGQALV